MKTTDALREIMKIREVGVTKLANRLNKKQNVISERLKLVNMSIGTLTEMVRVLDYKVVLIPSDETTPKGGYEIE